MDDGSLCSSGAGRLDVLTASPRSDLLTPCWSAPWPDVVTDVTWSEARPSAVVAATGDRAVVAFDTAKPGVRMCWGREGNGLFWNVLIRWASCHQTR